MLMYEMLDDHLDFDMVSAEKLREALDPVQQSKVTTGLYHLLKNKKGMRVAMVVIVPYRDAKGRVTFWPLIREKFMTQYKPISDVLLHDAEKEGGIKALKVGDHLLRNHEHLSGYIAEWRLPLMLGALVIMPEGITELEVVKAFVFQFSDVERKERGLFTGTLDELVTTAIHRERALKRAYYHIGALFQPDCDPIALEWLRVDIENDESRDPIVLYSSFKANHIEALFDLRIAFPGQCLLLDADDLLTGDVPTALELSMHRVVFLMDVEPGDLDEYGEDNLIEIVDSGIKVIQAMHPFVGKSRFHSDRLNKHFATAKEVWLDRELEVEDEEEEDEDY